MMNCDHPDGRGIYPNKENHIMRITRKQTYSALAGVGILLGTAGLAAASTGSNSTLSDPATQHVVAAANSDDADGGTEANEGPEQDESSYTSSATVADKGASTSEADEQTQLVGLATITADKASKAALASQPGTVTSVLLENENGNVVYSVIVDTGNGSVDVKVDAVDGSVLTTEADDDVEEHDGTDDEQDEVNEAPGAEVADD